MRSGALHAANALTSRLAKWSVLALTFATIGWNVYAVATRTEVTDYLEYLGRVREAQRVDGNIGAQIILVQSGASQNFDELDHQLRELTVKIGELQRLPKFLDEGSASEMQSILGDFDAESFDDNPLLLKVQRIERFKEQLARYRAAQTYFPTVAGDLAEELREVDTDASVNAAQIQREMITLNLDSDSHIRDRVDAEVNELLALREQKRFAKYVSEIDSVYRLAFLLTRAKPHLDGLSNVILAGNQVGSHLTSLHDLYEEGYARARVRDTERAAVGGLLFFLDVLAIAGVIVATIFLQREAIRMEHDRAETLLLNVLPASIADLLKEKPNDIIAESYADVSVLFADIVGFTPLAAKLSPVELVEFLNRVFSAFDRLAAKHGLEKIKTLGDAYMVAGGLPERREDHAQAIANMALDMQQEILAFKNEAGDGFGMRIGINSGPVVAGVIGIKKFIYDLWGDAVNVASRMESHGVPNQIHCSSSTYEHLKDRGYRFEARGVIKVKGKGEMQTYLLTGRAEPAEKQAAARA